MKRTCFTCLFLCLTTTFLFSQSNPLGLGPAEPVIFLAAPFSIWVPDSASSFSIADVNGDGKPDLVVATYDEGLSYDGFVGVLLGNGNGTFQTMQTYDSGGFFPYFVAVGDVNGDGKPDVVVANEYEAGTVNGGFSVLLGNGNGTLQPPLHQDFGGPNQSPSFVLADVNGDGKLDIVFAEGQSGPGFSVLLGNGDGTFQVPISYNFGEGSTSVAIMT